MLRFHILNVDHGDSIVIEYLNGDDRSFAVVDSNAKQNQPPKALLKLVELGAKELSFVCLTHPHRDHYRGLSQILHAFRGKIDQVLMFPAGEFLGAEVKKFAAQYRKLGKTQDDSEVTADALEFVRILKFLDCEVGWSRVVELTGPHNQVPVQGFDSVDIICGLPYRRMKGSYLERIRKNDPGVFESEKENDLSVVLSFRYAGIGILLSGDATRDSWEQRLGQERTRSLQSIHSVAAKLPHHGSKHDCTSAALEVIFPANAEADKFAFISANGVSHPHEDVLRALEAQNIKPYCTNLHRSCGANVERLLNTSDLDPLLGKYLNQLSNEPMKQPCQGDITFTVNSDGSFAIEREHKVACGYRGELGDLFAA